MRDGPYPGWLDRLPPAERERFLTAIRAFAAMYVRCNRSWTRQQAWDAAVDAHEAGARAVLARGEQ